MVLLHLDLHVLERQVFIISSTRESKFQKLETALQNSRVFTIVDQIAFRPLTVTGVNERLANFMLNGNA
jgi:hypothetical protein